MDIVLIILVILTISISLSQLGVILFFINFLKRNNLHEGAVKDAQEKSAAVIAQAVSKANQIVAEAEAAQLKKVEEQSKILAHLGSLFEEKVATLEQQSEAKLTESMNDNQKSYTEFLSQAEHNLEAVVRDDRQMLEQKTDQMIQMSKNLFEEFIKKLSLEVKNQLQDEMIEAKRAVEIYKKQRMATIDEKIIDILEEVLLRILGKKLSVKDEGEFVFQALEAAKKEHVFV